MVQGSYIYLPVSDQNGFSEGSVIEESCKQHCNECSGPLHGEHHSSV